jgi:type IV secretory pathway protease TraF
MKTRHIVVLLAALALGGCATSVSAPVAVQALSASAPLHISDISADAAPDVQVGEGDLGMITQKVRAYIQAEAPTVMSDAGASAYMMKIHVTRFERGNAFARAMLAGLGQIHIEGTIDLVDASGKKLAEYKVSKDFALGGIAGGTTTVDDVEDGFAKSIAEIVKQKA